MENCLQITDHWVTIISGCFTVILTFVATWLAWKTLILTIRDKQNTIAIKELQAQTKKLEDLYLYQIQPRFATRDSASNYIYIVNIGGDCFNLKVSVIGEESEKQGNPFENWDDFFSSSTERHFGYNLYKDKEFSFVFEDRFGNKMEQVYYNSKRKFSNVKMLS